MALKVNAWLTRHFQVAIAALGRLSRVPLSTLMTCAVIGITLALPTGLYLMLSNVDRLAGNWHHGAAISLFLQPDVTDEQTRTLAVELASDAEIAHVRTISRAQAMEEFRSFSGFGQALDALEENPLPPVLVLEPKASAADAAGAEKLLARMRTLPNVDTARLDLKWIERFLAFTAIAKRGILVIASLLAVAILLIVGNTIRLEIQNRYAEIEICQLVGATNAFIRRPFLYTGLWYGLMGGAIAWILVGLGIWLLSGPVARLAGLYQSEFRLDPPAIGTVIVLLCGSSLLGLAGSWLSVNRHLKAIEPG